MRDSGNVRRLVGRLAADALLMAIVATPAMAEQVSGTGRAPITRDTDSVHAAALSEARRQIVVALLRGSIGADRLAEVDPATIEAMAGQIRPDMIVDHASAREGETYVLTVQADVDGGWFTGQLSDFGIGNSSLVADNNRSLILVMLDEVGGTASDFSQPAETLVEYDRRTGGSYSDQSSVRESSRYAQAASSRSASATSSRRSDAASSSGSGAYRVQGSSAVGMSDGYGGAAAGRSSGSAAGGYSGRSASASSARNASASASRSSSAASGSHSYVAQNDVAAEVHDDVSYREHVVYQRPPQTANGRAIMNALSGALGRYDVATTQSGPVLASYFLDGVPTFAQLTQDARYQPFLGSLAAPFFMGGQFAVTHVGRDPATGSAVCSGSLDAGAFATADGRNLGNAQVTSTMNGISPEDCGNKLSVALAGQAATQMGPAIQRHWRTVGRVARGQDTGQLANYTLVLRAPALDMDMQLDMLEALGAIDGVSGQSFVSQDDTEMRFTVQYAGGLPLQLALGQRLRGKPAFAGLVPRVDGRSLLLCVGGC
ncbi:hypothetical protein PK98_15360 [Croceibacterium mercuriale]|uniref:Uncharacterized protein n=1 Tax=Croceibacterium mercuriale TaxID=1572751 RepID=A0A0B2BWY1_9SPHN|nr:hypothetical protein [Croceibacterium mercuriale]KHL24148.1 hypothetical protein PK98_15360 [Croceibacterium mercuriale]